MVQDVPAQLKLYHIVHVDRLPSIVTDGCLWCDARMSIIRQTGTTIGMERIKLRRLRELTLASHPDLHVGDCVPFYFCPRSVMLYLIHRGNDPDLGYQGGQASIIHLEYNLRDVVAWADRNGRRWAFTLTNAGGRYFEDCSDLAHLGDIDWEAVRSSKWSGVGVPQSRKEGKQAEFLVEYAVPWTLVERIGVLSEQVADQSRKVLAAADHRPPVEVLAGWYY